MYQLKCITGLTKVAFADCLELKLSKTTKVL